jgi:hypothetical protein
MKGIEDKSQQRIVKVAKEIVALSDQNEHIRNAALLCLQDTLTKMKALLSADELKQMVNPSAKLTTFARPPSRLSPLDRPQQDSSVRIALHLFDVFEGFCRAPEVPFSFQ